MPDFIPFLSAALDQFQATGGGRTQRFHYAPWGRHQDDRRWAEVASLTGPGGTTTDTLFTVRPISQPRRVADIGSGVQRGRQSVDVMLYWADGDDITDPAAYRKAVQEAVEAIVRSVEKTTPGYTYLQPVNSLDGNSLLGDPSSVNAFLHIISVEGEYHEVYGP
jgi:hypothetical protein